MLRNSILYLITIYTVFGLDYNENSTTNDLGTLYIQSINTAKVFCRYRIIEYNIEIENIQTTRNELTTTIGLLYKICSESQYRRICQLTLNEIKILMTSFNNKISLLESHNTLITEDYRKKRNTLEIPDILQKTLTLSDYGYSDLKQGLEQLKSTTKLSEKAQRDTLINIDHINFISLAQLVIQNIKRQLKTYDTILKIIVNKNPVEIADLIPLENLKSELKILRTSINKEFCDFPINLMVSKVIKLLKISDIQSVLADNHFIITLKIPTFYKNIFELLSATPIPFTYENATYEVLPLHQYLLTYWDQIKNDYYSVPLSIEEKQSCSHKADYLICFPKGNFQVLTNTKHKMPDYLFLPTYEICNMRNLKTLNDLRAIPNDCNIKRIPHLNKIIPLSENSYYLYIIRPIQVKFLCHKINLEYNITKPIVITDVRSDCSIFFDQGYHAEQRDAHFQSTPQHTTSSSTYSISQNDLIKRELMKSYNISTMRDLQPDFGELQERIRNMGPKTKPHSPIFSKQSELSLLILLTITMTMIVCYASVYFYKRITTTTNEKQENDSDKLDLSIATMPDLNCQFQFNCSPPIPPKTRSIPRSPVGSYDYPRTPTRRLEEILVHVSEQPDIQYATILKKNSLTRGIIV